MNIWRMNAFQRISIGNQRADSNIEVVGYDRVFI